MDYLQWRPGFAHLGETLEMSVPMGLPNPEDGGEGGSEKSAAGLPASYLVRPDELLEITLRFFESEWPAVQTFIRRIQASSTAFSFFPDQADEEHVYSCYLEAPLTGERVKPRRARPSSLYELTLLLRSITGPFDVQYFDEGEEV